MRPIFLFLFMLFLIVSGTVRGQCLLNPDFATYCGTTAGSCQYFNNPCLTNWYRSHGTPQIMTGSPSTLNVAYMWSANSEGEGLFADYSFVNGNQYSVLIRAYATGGAGNLRVYAANNLTEYTGITCGTPPPTPSSQQIINTSLSINAGWVEYFVTFTANNNYNQFLIYPHTTGATQTNLYVDFAKVCPPGCLGTINYTSGTVPAGTTRAAYINAGSGGAGTVNISSTATTNLTAGFEVNLSANFDATVTSGEFNASIEICSDGISRTRAGAIIQDKDRNIDVSKFVKTDSIFMARGRNSDILLLFPNPAKDNLTAELVLDPGDAVELKLLTTTGATIRQYKRAATGNREVQRLQISLAGLSKGIYFIHVISKKGVTIHKIEKME